MEKQLLSSAVLGALAGGGRVSAGDIQFNGKSLLSNTKDEWRKLRGTRISMIFQDCGGTLNPIRKIGSQYVEYICTHTDVSKAEAWKKGCSMLQKMRLPDAENIEHSYPHQLSGGMRQRVGIAMAMTFNPELLLADEPTGALDSTSGEQVMELFQSLNDEGVSVLMITHDSEIAAKAQRKVIIRDGIMKKEEQP